MYLGLRWLGLFFLAALAFLLQAQGSLTDINTSVIVALIVGGIINLILTVTLFAPSAIRMIPALSFIGDVIIVAIFAYVSNGESIMIFSTIALAVMGALLQSSLLISIIHVVGTLGAAVAVSAWNGTLPQLLNNNGGLMLIFVAGLSAAAVILAYFVGRRSAQLRRQIDAVGQERNAQLIEIRTRISAMYELSYTMGSTLDYEKVLEAALEAGRAGLRVSGAGSNEQIAAGVLLFHTDDNALHVTSSRRFTRGDMLRVIDGKNGIVGEALREAIPVFGSNPHQDPELQYFVAFSECKSAVCVPLRAGYDNFGVLIYGSERPNAFSKEHSELLTAIGVQATIALQNAVLYQSLLEEKNRIIRIEDDARRKLASDLHDGPTQNIAALAMRLAYAIKLLEKRPEELPDELQKLEDLARRTSVEMRQVLFTWRPLVLEMQGLSAALKQLGEKMGETHGQRVNVKVVGDVEYYLERNQQVVMFHIVEEALNNARKHANASQVNVNLKRQDDIALLEVADNGQGFDSEAAGTNNVRNSLGMINMRERAQLIEGTFNVESAIGSGTVISVVVPLKNVEGVSVETKTQRPRKSMTKLALAAAARAEKINIRDTKQ